MTDAQLLTLGLSLVIPLSLGSAAVLYSNSRITGTKGTLRAEIKAETATLRTEMAALRAEMAELRAHLDAGFERLAAALRIHELEHHK